ncbi:riboflavin synthase subunit alpha, partial [mine drainage metagenome]
REINELWVEAGPRLAGALLAERLVDELILYVAPKLFGPQARPLAELPELTQAAGCAGVCHDGGPADRRGPAGAFAARPATVGSRARNGSEVTGVFAGIVQDVGRLVCREERRGDLRMAFAFDRLDPAGMRLGDSICVQGCCLTVVELEQRGFRADVSRETLAVTTLGEMQPGARVNLESALRLGESLGGHLVTGHIDGLGRIVAMQEDGRSSRMDVALVDAVLLRY